MENAKKLELLTALFELEEGDLQPETVLNDLPEWDSMAKLSLIVLMDDECGKTLKNDQIKTFKTVQNIMDYME